MRLQADAIGEQQSKCSGRNRGAVEIGDCRAAEADASGEQQLKRTETGNSSLKRIDAMGGQQPKRTQSWGAAALHRELFGAGIVT